MKSVLAAICLACSVSGAELPADTKIEIRLKTKVSSNASKPHDPLDAIVIQPVLLGNQCVIPIDATLRGEVVKAEPSAAADQRALLQLDFNQLLGKRGKTIALTAKVADVDNGRESVDDSGVIQGIVASESLSNRMDTGLTKLGSRASGLADILQLAKTKFLKTTDAEIVYDSGVEMTLKLTAKETIDPAAISGMTAPVQATAADPRLQQLVNAQPFQTIAEKPPKPSDKTNLMFIGSQEQLAAAFKAAGWMAAAGLTKASGFETFAAIAEQRGYKEAPMSVLLLEDRPADLNYQKQNNTFSKRHHLRVWRRPVQWQGQDVWVASATHDIGIDFSAESRTFIHKIDPQIDEEKMKVVWDFLATGAVKYWTLVDRPNVPKESMNATGDKLITNGKMAVIVLGDVPATR
jgi:hypothetical protein